MGCGASTGKKGILAEESAVEQPSEVPVALCFFSFGRKKGRKELNGRFTVSLRSLKSVLTQPRP